MYLKNYMHNSGSDVRISINHLWDSEKALCAHSFMKFLVFQIKLKLMNKYKRMLTSTVVSWKKGSCFVLIEPSKMNRQLLFFYHGFSEPLLLNAYN